MAEAVTSETTRLTIVKFCKLGSLTARACDRIIEGLGFRSRKQVLVICKAFVDAFLNHVANTIPNWQVTLVFSLRGAECDESLRPFELIKFHSKQLVKASTGHAEKLHR